MPIVPRVEGPSVAVQPLPGARINPRNPDSSGLLRGVADLGNAVGKIVEKRQEMADTAQVLEAKRKLSDWERTWFDPRNEKGVYARKGRDAMVLPDEIAPDFDRVQSELSAGLRSQRARDTFLASSEGVRDSMLNRVQGYAVNEYQGYVKMEFEANVASSVNMAASAADEDRFEDFGRHTSEGLKAIRAFGALNGEDAKVTQFRESEFLDKTHQTAIFAKQARGDIDGAIAHMEAFADEMSAAAEAEVRSRMAPLILQNDADAIENGVETGRPMPMGSQPIQGAAGSRGEAEQIAEQSITSGRTARLEGTGDNPSSSADGHYQFIDGTLYNMLKKHFPEKIAGVAPPTRTNPRLPAHITAIKQDKKTMTVLATEYAKENARFLFDAGLPVTAQTVYMAHHFGPEGAARLLRASPDTPVKQVLDAKSYAANGYLHGKTVAQLVNNHKARVGEGKGAMDSGQTVVSGPQLVPTGRTSAEALRARAAEVSNPLLRRELERRADHQEVRQERAEREHREATQEAIMVKIEQGIPPGRLTAAEQDMARAQGWMSGLESRHKQVLAGTLTQDNFKMVGLLQRELVETPARFLARGRGGIMALRDQMSTSTLNEFLGVFDAAQKSGGKPADWMTQEQRLAGAYERLGLDKAKGKSNAAVDEKRGRFFSAYLMARKSLIQTRGGKDPTPVEEDALIKDLTRNFRDDPDQYKKQRAADTLAFGDPVVGKGGRNVALAPDDIAVTRRWLRERKGIANPSEAVVLYWAAKRLAR